MKRSKAYRKADELIEHRLYTPAEAMDLARKTSTTKFDPTVEVALRLGVGPRRRPSYAARPGAHFRDGGSALARPCRGVRLFTCPSPAPDVAGTRPAGDRNEEGGPWRGRTR